MAEQWPYRTAMLSEFAEETMGKDVDLDHVPLQSVYMSRPDELYASRAPDESGLSPIVRIDMAEDVMLSFLDQKPHVTIGDLYQLSRYLFNLSSAVRQAVKKDLAALSQPERQNACKRDQSSSILDFRPPSIIKQWASALGKELQRRQQHDSGQTEDGDGRSSSTPA